MDNKIKVGDKIIVTKNPKGTSAISEEIKHKIIYTVSKVEDDKYYIHDCLFFIYFFKDEVTKVTPLIKALYE